MADDFQNEDPQPTGLTLEDLKHTHYLEPREKPLNFWSYLSLFIFFVIVGAGFPYGVIMAIMGMGMRGGYHGGGINYDPNSNLNEVSALWALLLPGVIGGTIGSLIGLAICLKVWCEQHGVLVRSEAAVIRFAEGKKPRLYIAILLLLPLAGALLAMLYEAIFIGFIIRPRTFDKAPLIPEILQVDRYHGWPFYIGAATGLLIALFICFRIWRGNANP